MCGNNNINIHLPITAVKKVCHVFTAARDTITHDRLAFRNERVDWFDLMSHDGSFHPPVPPFHDS